MSWLLYYLVKNALAHANTKNVLNKNCAGHEELHVRNSLLSVDHITLNVIYKASTQIFISVLLRLLLVYSYAKEDRILFDLDIFLTVLVSNS